MNSELEFEGGFAEPTESERLALDIDVCLSATRKERSYIPLFSVAELIKKNFSAEEVQRLIKHLNTNG